MGNFPLCCLEHSLKRVRPVAELQSSQHRSVQRRGLAAKVMGFSDQVNVGPCFLALREGLEDRAYMCPEGPGLGFRTVCEVGGSVEMGEGVMPGTLQWWRELEGPSVSGAAGGWVPCAQERMLPGVCRHPRPTW